MIEETKRERRRKARSNTGPGRRFANRARDERRERDAEEIRWHNERRCMFGTTNEWWFR